MYQIIQYFKFLLKSTNQHGVHSPFVYNLVTKCFYDKTKYSDYKTLKNYRKALLNNKKTIAVTDLGAGSQTMTQENRQISQMAKTAGSTYKRTKLLYRLSQYFNPETVLELGTSLGISTSALSLGNPNANITTIEGCPNISEFTKQNFEKFNLKNITLKTGDFNDELNHFKTNTFDFVFFDGNHQKQPTLQYFETLIETVHNNSVFIFDDIYWSEDMKAAWELIKKHPKVTVTIDTFFWGFVFFRKEQPKEHFKIRV
ncbi:O-methyltransferase [Algibacter pacificus]|uniref:O-methyltransferase n=1 Tax=Algibacter pacificus TaxID=2599389 RepID=UPI0011C93C7F|nr:class I SAM-dependent methyltransferase [Algibacter pacificus]